MPPGYPWSQGDALFADDLNAAIASASAGGDTAINVIDYGADPTGVADSTTAFRAAVATNRRVRIPAGVYKITDAITVTTGQIIQGDGARTSCLSIPTTANMSAAGLPFVLGPGTREKDVEIRDLWIRFSQPDFAGMTRADIIHYPPAINTIAGNRAKFTNLCISNAWIGIDYDGGGAGFLDRVEISAYSIGLRFGQTTPVLDGTHVSNFHFWNFDMTTNQVAVAWDGVTLAADIGRIDGLVASDWVIFRASVIIRSTAGVGGMYYMSNIMLDSISSQLIIQNSLIFEALNFHFTKGGGVETPAILIQGGRNSFTSTSVTSSMVSTAAIQVTGGGVAFNGGAPWWKEGAAAEFVAVTGGNCTLNNITFATHAAAHTAPFVHQSGAGYLNINSCNFPPANVAGVAVQLDTVVAGNMIGTSNNFGKLTLAGAAIESSAVGTVNAQTVVVTQAPLATEAQLIVRGGAAGVNGAEGKLRLHGSFPTTTDYTPYLAASFRAGWSSASFASAYLDLWLTNATNSAASDANMTQVARFTPTSLALSVNQVTQGGDAVAVDQYYSFNTASGRSRNLRFLTAGSPRFTLTCSSTDDFVISNFDNAGAALFNSFYIRRLTGMIGVARLPSSTSYANDAAAAVGGVAVGDVYRNGSVMQVRVA